MIWPEVGASYAAIFAAAAMPQRIPAVQPMVRLAALSG
jgi:hypothetical protein